MAKLKEKFCFFTAQNKKMKKDFDKYAKDRSDVRFSSTYPPTQIRQHQMKPDLPTYPKI